MIAGEARTNLRPAIEAFYRAMIARDADLIGRLVDEYFADEAVLDRPHSLPGGGRTQGAHQIKRLMVTAATLQGGPLDVATMSIARVIEGLDDEVAVELEFPFAGEPTTALELWTVRDLKVQSIKSYYWDTKAILG
jgi:hypothetical protein